MKLNGLKAAALVLAIGFAAHAADLTAKQKMASANFKDKIADDVKAITTACGCAPAPKIAWEQFKTEDDLKIPVQGYNEVRQSLESLCGGDKTGTMKDATCKKVKTVVVNKGTPKDPTFAGGTITLTREESKGYGDLTKLLGDSL